MQHPFSASATGVLRALAFLAFAGPQQVDADTPGATEPAQDQVKTGIAMAEVKVRVSTEDGAAIPPGSHFEWEGLGTTCRKEKGDQPLWSAETPVTLPVCRLRLTIFITGFDTRAVTVDLVGREERFDVPIRITLRRNGPAEVAWSH